MAQTKSAAPSSKQTTATQKPATSVAAHKPQQQVALVSEADQRALAEMAQQDAGTGFEEATRESYATPFLVILQDLSPQCKPKMAGYIKGAEPGMILNTATQKLYHSGDLRVVPCHYSQAVIEWIPRDKGGGFVAAYSVAEGLEIMKQSERVKSRQVLPNGHELQLTSQHYVLVLDPDDMGGALIAMKSTQLKYSRRWMTAMKAAPHIEVAGQMRPPSMFDYSYTLGSEEEANEEGSWWSWLITDRQRVVADKGSFTAQEAMIYRSARDFRNAMAAGRAKVDWDSMQTTDNSNARPDIPGDVIHENDIQGA